MYKNIGTFVNCLGKTKAISWMIYITGRLTGVMEDN
jgi:hypothetical protein